jgi:hypothetical protein
MAKYKNKKVSVNGLKFDSVKEGKRYMQLLEKQQNGEISALQTQVKYVLIDSQYEFYERYGKKGQKLKDGRRLVERECAYIADFVYTDNRTGETVVEDTKGFKTKDYLIKRKLMLYVHGIKIKEV